MPRLLEAVFANDVAKVRSLFDSDPRLVNDINTLCQAIGWGRRACVELFIERGADLNQHDRNGNHPLSMACFSTDMELFGELIRKGSNPTVANGLAIFAAMHGRTDVLRHLQDSGINLNQPHRRLGRPIEAAVGNGHVETVECLLSTGVDTSTLDVTKPLVPWKGALVEPATMESIRQMIIKKRTEQRRSEK